MSENDNGTTYLGDGLYACLGSLDRSQIKVFAHNGIEETNTVYFDQFVLENFEKWVENLRERGVVPRSRQKRETKS